MKVKSLVSAAALCAATLCASPSFAVMQLSDKQMDGVTAGYDLGQFQTTILDINNQQYLDTVNILNPGFSWGTDTIHMDPLGGPSSIATSPTPQDQPPNHRKLYYPLTAADLASRVSSPGYFFDPSAPHILPGLPAL